MSETPVGLSAQPEGYSDWLSDLKGRIHGAQQRATLAVNRELVLLYWQILLTATLSLKPRQLLIIALHAKRAKKSKRLVIHSR